MIFDYYIRKEGEMKVHIDDTIRCNLFHKFGCEMSSNKIVSETQNLVEQYNDDIINQDILVQNLNPYLFHDLFNAVLESLEEAFSLFKKTINYHVLKEEIRRKEKLYEVMVEGKLIANT
jgi:hypothetical protein